MLQQFYSRSVLMNYIDLIIWWPNAEKLERATFCSSNDAQFPTHNGDWFGIHKGYQFCTHNYSQFWTLSQTNGGSRNEIKNNNGLNSEKETLAHDVTITLYDVPIPFPHNVTITLPHDVMITLPPEVTITLPHDVTIALYDVTIIGFSRHGREGTQAELLLCFDLFCEISYNFVAKK